jgi:hypothetical protein
MGEEGKKEKSEQNTVELTKKAGRRRSILSVVGIVILLLVLVVGLYYWQANHKPDCALLTQEAATLIKKKDFKQAYEKLEPHAEACGGTKSKVVTDNNKRLKYDFLLAVSAYQSGHKDAAKKYAQTGLEVNNLLSKGRVPTLDNDKQKVTFDLVFIKQGEYKELAPIE